MVTAYPQRGKQKSLDICRAFVAGCGGRVSNDAELRDGPAFFYGIDQSNVAIWKAIRTHPERDWFYADNAYLDQTRQKYFRVTKNALQHSGNGQSDGKRFKELGIEIKPWTTNGETVVMCPQSHNFMKTVVGFDRDWAMATMQGLSRITKRHIVVREWSPDKGKQAATLQSDLKNAHALVTWSSAAAITAVISGVPVVTMGQCAAAPMSGYLVDIEDLPKLEREEWCGVLADNQWTLDEMRSGYAWERLNA